METSILNEFLVLEETNSFSKAAIMLRISQATLSRHIKQLEDEYGVPLFERTTQKMKLTPFGEALVAYSRDILESEKNFKRDCERIKYKNSTHLVIGTIDFPFYYGITGLLAEFKRLNPSISLEVRIESPDMLMQLLKRGEIGIAFTRNIDNCLDSFDASFYHEDYIRIVVPASHPMASYKSATLSQFSEDTFYRRYQKNSLMDKQFQKMLSDAEISPAISTSTATWEDSVISDLSTVTTCTGGLAETFSGNIHLKVLTLEPKTHADIYIAALQDSNRPELTNRFIQFVREHTRPAD